jgi:hypothetical protein
MARDLVFGRTRRNWARGSVVALTLTSGSESPKLTEAEISMLAELAATKVRATAGDKKAQRKMRQLSDRVASLKKKAGRGDDSAARTLRVLQESGIFQPIQTFTMGADNQISNKTYRVAVLRQARRLSKMKKPTTLDFYRAKSAVDGAMRQAGISLFLPGSRRARATY